MLFAALDDTQRRQRRDLLPAMRDGPAAEADGACTGISRFICRIAPGRPASAEPGDF